VATKINFSLFNPHEPVFQPTDLITRQDCVDWVNGLYQPQFREFYILFVLGLIAYFVIVYLLIKNGKYKFKGFPPYSEDPLSDKDDDGTINCTDQSEK